MNTRKTTSRALLLCIPWLAAVAAAAPILTVTPEALDFGKVREGAVPELALTVTNTGDAPARIQKLQTSCGCIELPDLSEDDRLVPPGATREYAVKYKTLGYQGQRSATLALTADDVRSPHLVKVGIEIEMALRVVPRVVHWPRAHRGDGHPEVIMISAMETGTTLHLEGVQSPLPHLLATAEPATVDGQPAIAVRLSLDDTAPLGTLTASVDVKVILDDAPHSVQIPVTANVIGDLLFHPSAIVGVNRPFLRGTRLSEITLVPSEAGALVRVLGVAVSGPIRADVPEVTPAEKIIVPIAIAPDAPAGPQAGTVTIFTTSADLPVVTVPVFFQVIPPVSVDPPFIILVPDATPQTVTLRAAGQDLKISDSETTRDQLVVTVVAPKQDGDNPATLEIALQSAAPASEETAFAIVRTNIPGAEEIRIPIIIKPRG